MGDFLLLRWSDIQGLVDLVVVPFVRIVGGDLDDEVLGGHQIALGVEVDRAGDAGVGAPDRAGPVVTWARVGSLLPLALAASSMPFRQTPIES